MEDLIKQHKEKFNKEPFLIGMFFYDPEQTKKNIEEAIKKNKPYNEYEMLTPDERNDYDNGDLLF